MIRRGLWLALFSLVTLPLFAQTTGGIVGRVTDTNGAAVPGVTVEAKSRALQGTRSALSDPEGLYRFALLPPGEYTLVFNLSGFGPATRTGVVALGKDSTFDVSLRLASVSETMTVSAEAKAKKMSRCLQ